LAAIETPSIITMDGYTRPPLPDYENGTFADDAFSQLFTNVPSHDLGWGLSNNNDSLAPSTSSHLNWPQASATTPNLDTYGRSFSKSPSVTQTTANYGYSDHPLFSQSAYDPSLVPSSSTADPTSLYVSQSQYLQQPLQQHHGTIAPQALQQGQPHFARSLQSVDTQVR